MAEGLSLYQVLGCEQVASFAEIRACFKRQALSVHPDKGGSKEAFQQVLAAFEILADPLARARYDRHHLADARPAAKKGDLGQDAREEQTGSKRKRRRRQEAANSAPRATNSHEEQRPQQQRQAKQQQQPQAKQSTSASSQDRPPQKKDDATPAARTQEPEAKKAPTSSTAQDCRAPAAQRSSRDGQVSAEESLLEKLRQLLQRLSSRISRKTCGRRLSFGC
ncbi:unnamed protein product [Polarella glacialis]|uniref:J domain-containing protein n=1 Tax=Polarella glacialis TaxID=89957 RepID=A0A813KEW0_POLGL|nr:unnamed protein product [Polarella glacialis]